MILVAGISFGLFCGTVACLFLHPVFRLKISPERRQRLMIGTIGALLGAGVAGALLALLGKDAVIGLIGGLFPGFIGTFAYLEARQQRLMHYLAALEPQKQAVVEKLLKGELDPADTTSQAELNKILDQAK